MSKLPSKIASSGEWGSASASDILAAGLGFEKTGANPFHYTLTFPGPVDQNLADIFNGLFYGSGP